jgi:proline iminopeptidase
MKGMDRTSLPSRLTAGLARKRWGRRVRDALLLVLVVLVGASVGLLVLIAAAAATAVPALFLLAGLAAFCATLALGLLVVTRGGAAGRRRRIRAISVAVSALVVSTFVATALLPLDDPRVPPARVAGQQLWDLPTGSRIAYVRLPAQGHARATPVIFLHGGPGVPDMRGDTRYFGQLTRDGFDVYVYDELGSGRSSRLADPRGYTLARDVADLEAIRRQIGAQQVILIGHSYGGELAAAYLATQSRHVAKVVFSSPGDLAPSAGGASMVGRLTTAQQRRLYATLLQPRALLAYALLQVNPRAAHAFAGDAEMDARFDVVYNLTKPALHCRGAPPGPELHGLGFYANQYPQSATRRPHADYRPALAAQHTPALVIKGSCDYLSWSSAQDYLRTLPHAQLLYLRGAGHNAYQDKPAQFMAAVQAFLTGRPLPEQPYTNSQPPQDYEARAAPNDAS